MTTLQRALPRTPTYLCVARFQQGRRQQAREFCNLPQQPRGLFQHYGVHALHLKQQRGKLLTWTRKRQVPQTTEAIKFCCWMKTSKTGADLCTATIILLSFADTRPRLSNNCKCDAFVESTNSKMSLVDDHRANAAGLILFLRSALRLASTS